MAFSLHRNESLLSGAIWCHTCFSCTLHKLTIIGKFSNIQALNFANDDSFVRYFQTRRWIARLLPGFAGQLPLLLAYFLELFAIKGSWASIRGGFSLFLNRTRLTGERQGKQVFDSSIYVSTVVINKLTNNKEIMTSRPLYSFFLNFVCLLIIDFLFQNNAKYFFLSKKLKLTGCSGSISLILKESQVLSWLLLEAKECSLHGETLADSLVLVSMLMWILAGR